MPVMTLPQLLVDPLYAALAAALVTLVMSYIYDRIRRADESLFDYIVRLLYVGGLVYVIVFIITNPKISASTSTLMY